MSRTLTASDRKSLIRLASTMPVGSPERKAILNGLSKSATTRDPKVTPEQASQIDDDYVTLTTEDFRSYDVFISLGRALGAGDMGALRRAYDDMMLNLDELGDYEVEDARPPRKGDRALGFTVHAERPRNVNGTKWHNDQIHMQELWGVMKDFQGRLKDSPVSIRQAHITETDDSKEAHKERGAAMKRLVQLGAKHPFD